MASLSMPPPKKISDVQLVGDLMSLFERRKVKCGDASALESFASQMESNSALRSDLFTLCTAISHMAAEDLTGEELLVLVARAVGGPGIAKGAAAPEIPESMRKAFLEGYAAWGNRAALSIEEPLEWPPPRKNAVPADSGRSQRESAGSESGDPAESSRTIQEALQIARDRAPNGVLSPRTQLPIPGAQLAVPDIEHLTISELKKLLAEIEHRVSRIEPQLGGLAHGRLGDFARGATPSENASELRRAVLAFESGTPVAPAISPVDSKFDEKAFIERHAYLRPASRPKPVEHKITELTPPPAELIVPAPVEAAEPEKTPLPAEVKEAPKVESAALTPVMTEDEPSLGLARLVLAKPGPAKTPPPPQFLDGYSHGVDEISTRMKVGGLLAVAGLFLIAFTLGAIYVNNSRPKTIRDFPELSRDLPAATSPAPSSPPAEVPTTDVKQVRTTVDARQTPPAANHSTYVPPSRPTHAGNSKWQAAPQPSPSVAVWPPVSRGASDADQQAASRGITPMHAPSAANGGPSTTIIGYATKSAHPEQAGGASGTVMLDVTISKQGAVTDAQVISGPPALHAAAIETVKQWRFKPSLVNGVPTEVRTTLGVYFKGE